MVDDDDGGEVFGGVVDNTGRFGMNGVGSGCEGVSIECADGLSSEVDMPLDD
jgi:hypothetical protein